MQAGTGKVNSYFTKSDFLLFRKCPEELWLKWNLPDKLPPLTEADFHNIEQGQLIDRLARDLFQDETFLKKQGLTIDRIQFQQEFFTPLLKTKPDILFNIDDKRCWLFEVKAATKLKDDLKDDLAFQKIVLQSLGRLVEKVFLVHVNPDFIHSGDDLQLSEFLMVTEVTTEIDAILPDAQDAINRALILIQGPKLPKRIPIDCPEKKACPFFKMHYPDWPAYSIWEITRISKTKLKDLIAQGIYDIHAVPPDFKLSKNQRLQVDVAQQKRSIINTKGIRAFLDKLTYPLFFLDYETFSYVLPYQARHRAYQQMVFQYSLHILQEPRAELQHAEYLLREKTEPVLSLVQHLEQHLHHPNGSVIVWHDAFEKARNQELAAMYPDMGPFLQAVNDRIVDLEDIFKCQHYVHPAFKGKSSIKKVLPVLAPEYDYSTLEISNGQIATLKWHHMTEGLFPESEAQKVYQDLLDYCRMDTLAMVKIWERLLALI